MKRNVSIDIWRMIATIFVVVGHVYCFVYQEEFQKAYGYDQLTCHNTAVDIFFILSGMFLATHISTKLSLECEKSKLFQSYIASRVKRLLLPMVFSSVMYLLYDAILRGGVQVSDVENIWPAFFFLGGINGINGKGFQWYVCVLFWVSFLYAGLLIVNEQITKLFIIPIICFFCISYMYNSWGSLILGYNPILANGVSAGFLRGLLEMAIGIEVYYIAEKLRFIFRSVRIKKVLIGCCEIFCVFRIATFAFRQGSYSDYLVLIYFSILVIIYLKQEEIVGKLLADRKWVQTISGIFNRSSLIIYLMGNLWIMVALRLWKNLLCIKPIIVYTVITIFVLIMGFISNCIYQYFEKMMKKMICSMIAWK